MKLPSIDFLLRAVVAAFRRFPLPMLTAMLGVYAALCLIGPSYSYMHTYMRPIFMVCFLALPLFTGITLWAESKGWTKQKAWIALAIASLLVVAYWSQIDLDARDFNDVQMPRFLVLVAVLHLWVSFAPFLGRESVEDFWEYNKQLFGNIFTGFGYSFVLWAGISIAHLAVNELFDAHLEGDNYARLFAVIFGLFNTAFFLFHLPKDFHFDTNEIAYTAVFKNLCKYILIPITALYFLILYAYTGKILVTWDLPHGWVSSLVIGFAAAGIFTWLLNYLLPQNDDSQAVAWFGKWFWLILFPMVGLLFVAVGWRIRAYGVTEERFMVAHIGAWLLLCCVFFVIIRSRDLRFVPMSLAAFLLAGIYGPFSAFASAERSQKHQFKALLEQNGMLSNGLAKPAVDTLKGEGADRLISCLDYFNSRGKLQAIQPFFAKSIDTINLQSSVATWLNIQASNPYGRQYSTTYSVSAANDLQMMDITAYQYFQHAALDNANPSTQDENQHDRLELMTVLDENLIVWHHTMPDGKAQELQFSLQSVLETWAKKANVNNNWLSLQGEEAIVSLNSIHADLKLCINSCTFTLKNGKHSVDHLEGNFFLKMK